MLTTYIGLCTQHSVFMIKLDWLPAPVPPLWCWTLRRRFEFS